jgi:hypothetical protein
MKDYTAFRFEWLFILLQRIFRGLSEPPLFLLSIFTVLCEKEVPDWMLCDENHAEGGACPQ